MSDASLRKQMEQIEMELLQDDMNHDCWVVVVWLKGQIEGHHPEAAHGPYASAHEALAKAEQLRAQMERAPGRTTFLAGYTPTISVVPVFGDEEEEGP